MVNRIKEEYLKSDKYKMLGFAWAHSQLGMYKEAIADCENLVALDASDPDSHRELAVAYEENNQIDKAIECYRSAISRFPDHHKLYTNLGHLFQEYKKHFDMAIVCYEKALALNPEDYWALHNIGTVFKKEYKIKEAFYCFQKAHKISESKGVSDRKIIHNLAWASYRCKKFEQALHLYAWLAERYDDSMSQFDKALSIQQDNRFYMKAWELAFRKTWR